MLLKGNQYKILLFWYRLVHPIDNSPKSTIDPNKPKYMNNLPKEVEATNNPPNSGDKYYTIDKDEDEDGDYKDMYDDRKFG